MQPRDPRSDRTLADRPLVDLALPIALVLAAGGIAVAAGGVPVAAVESAQDERVDAVPVDSVPVDAVPVDAVPVDAVPVAAAPGPASTRASSSGVEGFDTIDEDDVEATIATLTNPYLEGRDSPSFGLEFSAEWVADQFEAYGVQPFGEGADAAYITPYTRRMPQVDAEGTALETPLERELALGVDYTALLDAEGQASGPAVFCGYGIDVKSYEGLEDLDLAGAIAVLVVGEPRHKRVLEGPELSPAANVYRKLARLEDLGAVGALVVRRDVDEEVERPERWPERQPMGFRHTWAYWADGTVPFYGPSPIPALEISWSLAEELLDDDLDARMGAIDAKGKPDPWEGPRPLVSLACAITTEQLALPNVVGFVPGTDPDLKDEYVVVGAHLDHIGADPLGRIGVGADDNASGTSAMLEVMQAFAADPAPRSVIGVAFTSEEDGLIGSAAFARTPPVALGSITAMVNLDMIGRGPTKEVVALGVRENPGFEDVLKDARRRFRTGVKDVETEEGQELFQRSDHYSFHQVGVPAIFFFEHVPISENPDYHTWRDVPELVDVKKITNTARLAYAVVRELTELEERLPAPRRR